MPQVKVRPSHAQGIILVLTVSTMADRTCTVHGDSVFPDEILVNPAAVVDRAIEWLATGQ